MCKECGSCSKEHAHDPLAGVDAAESSPV
jgi:hypothetical protein